MEIEATKEIDSTESTPENPKRSPVFVKGEDVLDYLLRVRTHIQELTEDVNLNISTLRALIEGETDAS